MADTKDVAQLVIRSQEKYFLARRTKDNYWEWIGGKRKENEAIEEAAVRELKEEIQLKWKENDYSIEKVADPYPSEDNPKYNLYPVLIELDPEKADEISENVLSEEHDSFEWIDLTNFYEYESIGQFKAIKQLGLVEGEVATSVPRKNGKYVVLRRSEQTSSSGYWNFPGGRIEEGETKKEAALRELKEETGLEGQAVRSGKPYLNRGELGVWRLHPFLVEAEGEVELNHEHDKAKLVSLGELDGLKTLGEMESIERLDL
ncbi:MAG: NUDIX hydrolase [Nanohaloarchaea archaeon]|nr:NUDIX hydrolase [Candidatus Nanohaloarchaea archaeon]